MTPTETGGKVNPTRARSQPTPELAVLHVLADETGRGHIHRCAIDGLTFAQVVPDVPRSGGPLPSRTSPVVRYGCCPTVGRAAGTVTRPSSGSSRSAAVGPSRPKTAPVWRWARERSTSDDLDSTPDEDGRVGHDSGVLGAEPCTV